MALVLPLTRKSGRGFPSGLNKAADTLDVGAVSATGLAMNANTITGLANAVNPTDAVTLQQAEGLIQGLKGKGNAIALSDTNQTLSGVPANIDGITTLAANDVILLTNQTTGSENGAWVVKATAWIRPDNFAAGSAAANSFWFVESGTNYADQGWYVTNDTLAGDTVGTHSLTISQFNGLGTVNAGNGISKTGNILSAVADPNGALSVTAAGIKALAADTTVNVASAGLSVVGVPSLFEVNGVSTTANVSAANLNTLTGGGDATSLHTHSSIGSAGAVSNSAVASAPINNGSAVYIDGGTGLQHADNSVAGKDLVTGVVVTGGVGGATLDYISEGLAAGVLTGAAPGTEYWLGAGGALTAAIPTADDARLIRVGIASSATDLLVKIMDFGDV